MPPEKSTAEDLTEEQLAALSYADDTLVRDLDAVATDLPQIAPLSVVDQLLASDDWVQDVPEILREVRPDIIAALASMELEERLWYELSASEWAFLNGCAILSLGTTAIACCYYL